MSQEGESGGQLRPGPLNRENSNGRNLIPSRPQTASSLRNQIAPGTPDAMGFNAGDQSEGLLHPSRSRTHRFRDDDVSGAPSPAMSGYSSRRTSWSSDQGSRDSRIYSQNPFADSRAPSRAGSDDEQVTTQTVSEKYNILPSAGLLLFPEDVEKDDWLHNPDPNEKEKRECDIFTKRGMVNVGGLLILVLGLLAVFIAYPIATFVKKHTVLDSPCRGDPDCITGAGKFPIFKNIRGAKQLVDPDTPQSAMSKKAADGKTDLKLVWSDEFNTDGRTFYEGDDPYWQAVDIWYGVTQDLEWYDPDAATTKDGVLELRFDAYQNHGLNYRSGMLQTWNQMCFQGGYLEASISLPGRGDVMGFWPGFWAMGNLGRPGYAATTDGMWPFTYHDECDPGITPNQSMVDGLSYLPGMRLPACTCDNEKHPSPGKGRSAPEIDVIEASAGSLDGENTIGQVSQSFQLAPFDIWWYPDYDYVEIYDDTITSMNGYTGGPFQEALSAVSNVNNDWYDGNAYQTYAFEYEPGPQGYVTWYVGKDKTWSVDARAIRPNGNVGQRVLPYEPMALIMNFGMSNSFAALNMTGLGKEMPAKMRFDYVRIYQDTDSDGTITCDPPGYPTTNYIAQHGKAYQNPNNTQW
jgi:beta-glucanase (GH16 family)